MEMVDYLYNLATDKYQGFLAGVFKSILLLFSLIYGLLVRALIFFSQLKRHRLNCRVISVGNITLGGTGKTSLVEYLARFLQLKGHKVAVLSRGYKRKVTSQENMGDEAYMLSQKLSSIPVVVNQNRIRGGQRAIKDYQVDTVILDDGFQQWHLFKDLEIVAIDATEPFGNQNLIPRGILREPLSSLRRADILILTKTNLNPDNQEIKDFLVRINPWALILAAEHQPLGFYSINQPGQLLDLATFKEKPVSLFSGIGDPDSFENLIISLGIDVRLSFNFRDHHDYTQKDLERISQASHDKNINAIITTEKDAVRLSNLQLNTYNLQLFVLRIALKITQNEERFHSRLLRLYHH